MRRIAFALLAAPAALLGLFYAYPLGSVLAAAGDGGEAWRWLAGPYVRHWLGIATLQAVLSVLLVLAVAVPLAWLHHRRAVPRQRLLLSLAAAPFVLPVFAIVLGLRQLLGPGGFVDGWLGFDLLSVLGPLGAVVLANATYNVGMATRLLHTALERRPHRLEEAARTLGAAPGAAFWRTGFPLLFPSLLAVALLTFLFCFGSFGVVLYLGQGEVETVETLLYANLSGAFPREDRGAVLALLQIAVQAAVLAGYFLLLRRSARLPAAPERAASKAGPVATAAAWASSLLFLAPALAVLPGGFRLRGEWSLRPWQTLLDADAPGHLYGFEMGRAVGWSLGYAAASMLLAILLTLLLAYGARRLGRLRRVAEALAALPLGTSSLVLGFGFLLSFHAATPLPLQGTPLLVVAAHTLVAFPFTARILIPALDGIDVRLEETAATLGAPPWHRVLRVHLPLLRGPLAVAAGFAAAISLGDFGASLLLMTDDIMGVGVWILRHGGPGAFDPLARAQSTALAGLLMTLTLAAFLAAELGRAHRRTP